MTGQQPITPASKLPVVEIGRQVTPDEILAYKSGTPRVLVVRFRCDGFEGAASLAELMEQFPAQLSGVFTYSALVTAFVESSWPVPEGMSCARARVFPITQYLHERPEVMQAFMHRVVPFLECSVLVGEGDYWAVVACMADL